MASALFYPWAPAVGPMLHNLPAIVPQRADGGLSLCDFFALILVILPLIQFKKSVHV